MMYTIRNASEKSKELITDFAAMQKITVADAMAQLVEWGWIYYEQNKRKEKKYLNSESAVKNLPKW